MSRTGRELYDLWRAGSPGRVAPDRWDASSDAFRHRWNYVASRWGGKIDVTARVAELDPGFHNVGPDESRTDFKGFSDTISDFSEYEGIKRVDPKKWEIPQFEVKPEDFRGKKPLTDEQIADEAGKLLHGMLVELLDEPDVREAILESIFGEPEESKPENLETQKLQAESGLDWLLHQ